MLDRIFDRIEGQLGPAFWAMCETSFPPPPLREITVEIDLLMHATAVRICFRPHAQQLGFTIEPVPRDIMRQMDRCIRHVYASIESGYRLYRRWLDVGQHMVEQYDLDRDSILADLSAAEAYRLERLAVDCCREAANRIAQAVRDKDRFRDVFAICYPRSRPMFDAWDRPVFMGIDLARNLTATELLDQQYTEALLSQRAIRAERRHEIEYRAMRGMGGSFIGGSVAPSEQYARSLIGQLGPRQAVTSMAEERAWGLLLEHLTDEQKATLERSRYFEVRGGRTGATYRIRKGTALNIDVIEPDGRCERRLCFQPRGASTTGDTMLAQKVMLELDEDAALRVANVHRAASPASLVTMAVDDPWPVRQEGEVRRMREVWQSFFGR